MIRRAFLLIVGAMTLGSCADYHPLYANSGVSSSATEQLSEVSIEPQNTRAGQLLRNNLLEGMGSSRNPHFVLRLVISEHTNTVSALSVNLPSRMRYSLVVDFSLVEMANGHIAVSGKSFSNVSYDSLNQPVSDMAAASNAMSRAATDSSQDIRQRIAAFFSTRKS